MLAVIVIIIIIIIIIVIECDDKKTAISCIELKKIFVKVFDTFIRKKK